MNAIDSMAKQWLNLGSKDEYGQQRRIEYRGRNLRASRTGGVSLRAQTKAAGINLTANTSHGVRVSRTIGRNTQLALQNGRLVFRGHYGSGPTKLNLSKTGATVSTRNALGTFNWIKPNRSSAKVLGVQVRGKKAANLQLIFMLFQAVAALVELAIMLFLLLVQIIGVAARWLWGGLREVPFVLRQLRRRLAVWRGRRQLKSGNGGLDARKLPSALTTPEQLLAACACLVLSWGRGKPAEEELQLTTHTLPVTALQQADATLQGWLDTSTGLTDAQGLGIASLLGEAAAEQLPGADLPALLFDLDDLALRDGPKNRLQEDLLAVFADAAGLRLVGRQEAARGQASPDRL